MHGTHHDLNTRSGTLNFKKEDLGIRSAGQSFEKYVHITS